MSSLRRPKRAESLDMLVDTMCDAFGSIVLMAVLVSLLAQQTKKQSPLPSGASDTLEIFQRRIQQAEADLKDMIVANANLNQQLQGSQDLAALIQRRQQLRDELTSLNQKHSSKKSTMSGEQSRDPVVRQKQIEAAIRQAAVEKTSMENALAAQVGQNRDLGVSIAQLQTQLATVKEQEVRRLRLPKETGTTKTPLFVLLWEGKAFPVRLGPDQQNPAVERRDAGKDSTHLAPISGQGMNPALLVNVVRQWPSGEYYVVFGVFEDSFSSFQAARQSVANAGYNYGWQPFRKNDKFILSSEGKKTATQ